MQTPDIVSAPANAGIFTLEVTTIEPRFKHPTIFRHFDELAPGTAFRIRNDHDPKPLYYQLIAERGNVFGWTYLEKGPEWWLVEIRKIEESSGETVGEIAAKDLRKAEVFRKYGIDFCCGGKKSLQQTCAEKGLDLAAVEAELDQAGQSGAPTENYEGWDPAFLADYIYNKHHRYYYDEAPIIADLLNRVSGHHGATHPQLAELKQACDVLFAELGGHFAKEEKVLFPFIKALAQAEASGDTRVLQQQFSLREPVQMMEADHEAAGELLESIRRITNNYNLPEGTCNSFALLYSKLKNLEADLHTHIHLENNVLFPKALKLERKLRN
ncbi:iron-sulfur cluster repair di-iron protein [Flaviaesturariibacter flavus]|uniref:Iron-sulfur cluster repair di-iron protein n=1 Tax=Flaviaesturariibacter flavus TaxID=2502780 RepID=A0A4R1B7D1_9BACT|nr:iron-sulfur cluster repair di-iron protein [Flaviaesturariibacter flavus]TCJ12135.1 iron-sulfur cluster repair di-iron protein [Flaviaesturariibacter flavus]